MAVRSYGANGCTYGVACAVRFALECGDGGGDATLGDNQRRALIECLSHDVAP